MYSASDPHGQYQRWVDGKRDSTFTPDRDYIQKYVDPQQDGKLETSDARMPVMVEMRALMGHMNALCG